MSDKTPTSDIPPDPIYAKSLSVPIFLASLAVLVSTAIAIVDEFQWRRPYKAIQQEWKTVYPNYLEGLAGERRTHVNDVLLELDEYKALTKAQGRASDDSKAARDAIQLQISNVDSKLAVLLEAIKSPRSEIAAESYKAEHAAQVAGMVPVTKDVADAKGYLEKIERINARKMRLEWDEKDGLLADATVTGQTEDTTVGVAIAALVPLQEKKASLQRELGGANGPLSAATARVNAWKTKNLGNIALLLDNLDDEDLSEKIAAKVSEVGAAEYLDRHTTALEAKNLQGEIDRVKDWSVGDLGVSQIHIPDARNWVDRCETCHLNTRAPLAVNASDMGGNNLFASHPRPDELLATHDPNEFGCSMCHNGNGVAVTSAKEAHGYNKYWLMRMFPSPNYETGCNQCHVGELHIENGERITAGKENFRKYGCWGCHKMEGYDPEPAEARLVAKQIADLDAEMQAKQTRIGNLKALLDPVFDADEERFSEMEPENKRQRSALAMEIAGLRTQKAALQRMFHDLNKERKRVGPNLKDVRSKVKRGWITQWVQNPKGWRPSTKMPVFRWHEKGEAEAVAAFLWQSSTDTTDRRAYNIETIAPGDPTAGEAIFDTVGCLACHSIDRGDENVGNDFAANLTNLGEKNHYDYVVRWVENPRHRIAPYCADCATDITPAEFAAGAEKAAFTRDHTNCPNCGHELQWDNPTVMPSFRLSRKEARDVATYLVNQGGGTGVDMSDPAPWLDDKALFEKGKRLVAFHGCAGCHEIAGLEDEGRIGTELSQWGSKPMERLDFGHYTSDAKRGIEPLLDFVAPKDEADGNDTKLFTDSQKYYAGKWYNHRGFILHKLAKPEIFDDAKNLDRPARLRMPRFDLSAQEMIDIATFVMGSIETRFLPESMKYTPDAEGEAIRKGWWVVRKYNCEGCHEILPGTVPAIQELPHFIDGQENAADRPPYLVATGFRTQPGFLASFLKDPSLGGGTKAPKSLRPHLSVRMPTFSFTDSEANALVQFFDAMAKQPAVYQPEPLVPLTAKEEIVAQAIFKGANCTQCHVVTGQAVTEETKAPNLTYSGQRLRPEWIARWLQNPAELEPPTAMPALFRLECGKCKTWYSTDEMANLPEPDTCSNCGEGLGNGRWVYQDKALKAATDYKGDHIDLMVRYLRALAD